MRHALVISLFLCSAGALAGAAPRASALIESRPGRVEIDWTQGRIRAVGAGAADLRAPGPEIARIGAERRARIAAAERLLEAARALAWDGGTVGAAVAEDDAARARLAAAVGQARDVDVRWASDGSVEVTLALPLEAVRAAVAPPPIASADPEAPTALIVDATGIDRKRAPSLGVVLAAGDERFAGPTIWFRDPAAAAGDARLGDRPVKSRAVRADGTIELDLDPAELARARAAGALVVIVLPEGKR